MNTQQFETLVVEYKGMVREYKGNQFDMEWENKAEALLDQIADIHTTNPEHYEPILRKHKVSY